MKIAICFSGELREFDKTVDFFKSLSNKYDIDFYGSFWDTITEPRTSNAKKIPDNYLEHLNTLNLKKVEFEDFEVFKVTTLNQFFKEYNPPYYPEINYGLGREIEPFLLHGGLIAMWYKIWKCNALTKRHDYDVVLRTRSDIYMDDKFEIIKNNYLNIPEHVAFNSSWLNCIGPTDALAFGEPEIMDYYCSLFLYLTRYLKEGHYFFPAENILKVHLCERNLEVRHFNSAVFFARTNTSFGPQSANDIIAKYNRSSTTTDPIFSFYKPYN